MRLWEERFRAQFRRVGFAKIRMPAQRPPREPEVARLLAAEHWAFCDECAGRGLRDISSITGHRLHSPIWTF